MDKKKAARIRRAKSTRSRIRILGVPRLSVLRTGQHLYAQVFTADGSKVLAAANTLQADVKEGLKNGNNTDAAIKVGRAIGPRLPGLSRWPLTAPATAIMAASRHWPMRRVRVGWSFNQTSFFWMMFINNNKWLRHK